MSPEQCWAARELLGWPDWKLAHRAGCSVEILRTLEAETRRSRPVTLAARRAHWSCRAGRYWNGRCPPRFREVSPTRSRAWPTPTTEWRRWRPRSAGQPAASYTQPTQRPFRSTCANYLRHVPVPPAATSIARRSRASGAVLLIQRCRPGLGGFYNGTSPAPRPMSGNGQHGH
jgi:hypothetical protein